MSGFAWPFLHASQVLGGSVTNKTTWAAEHPRPTGARAAGSAGRVSFRDAWLNWGPAPARETPPGVHSLYVLTARAVWLVETHPTPLSTPRGLDAANRTATGQTSVELAAAKPLFLFYAPLEVHGPLMAPARFVERYAAHIFEPRRLGLAMVSFVDEAVANLTAALHRRGLWRHTFFVLASDNGKRCVSRHVASASLPCRH